MADKYLLQAEQAIREEDYEGARAAMEKILLLQAEHDLTLPDEFHFKYARVAALENLPEQALESVVKYLAMAGREGEHYVEALELMNTVQAAASCKGWNTEGYFETATLEQVTACLDTGVDLEAKDDDGRTPLHLAAFYNENPAVIEALLAAGADVKAQDKYKRTPLHRAAQFNENPAVIEALLNAGADPKTENNLGQTPLHDAARYTENPEVIGALLLAGADLEARNEDGYTPLHLAAQFNESPAVIEALLAAEADLEAKDDDGRTPLHRAAFYNENPAVIEALLLAGADLGAKDDDGRTPLHRAAFYNENPAVIEALLLAGADLEARNEDGYTPLHLAAQNNENPAVVEALLAAGADRTIALYIAVQNNENPAVVQVLIDAGADPTKKVQAAQNCKQWNKEKFFREATVEDVIACLDAGADPMARGKWDKRPLHLAARYNENPEVVKVLIAAGADVEARSKDGLWGALFNTRITPLHWAAAYNGNPEVVKVLIDAGADVEAQDGGGNTPLHWAAGSYLSHDNHWNPEVAKALIAAGADVDAGINVTPLHFAARYSKNPEVVKVLIDAGANQMVRTKKKGKTPLQLSRKGNKKVLRNAWAGLTIERQKEMKRAAAYRAQARRKAQSGPGLFDVAVGVLGGTAIAAAGGGTEEAMEAGAVFAESVIGGQQPVGNEDFNSGAAPSQAQGGQGQDTAGGALNAEDFSTGGVIVSNCAREGTRACIKNRNSQPAFVRFCTPDVDGQYKPALCVSVTVRANGGFVYQGSVDHVAEIYSQACALDNTKGPKEQSCYFELP